MKKTILSLIFLSLIFGSYAQKYDTQKLEELAVIWSECYLFHPAVVRADMDVKWEKQLVEFLPLISGEVSDKDFIESINSGLLSVLNDPLTTVQPVNNPETGDNMPFTNSALYNYIKFTANDLSNLEILPVLDSVITDRRSAKPLVIDCRADWEITADEYVYCPFHYFASMLIDSEIPLSMSVSREHFGWDELNDWWFYEQRWKIAQDDKQQSGNGILKPFPAYLMDIQQYLYDFEPGEFTAISRPVYFIVNKSFLSYYFPVLQALQVNRDNTFVIFEESGKVFCGNENIKRYRFDGFEFMLNTAFYINNGSAGPDFDMVSPALSQEKLSAFIHSSPKSNNSRNLFSARISPKEYLGEGYELSTEEKILGVIKIWAVVKYFYAHPESCSVDWEESLGRYLELAQNTTSDKEYYTLVQEMMATLNDSHVSVFHPSILDFSEIFVAPVQFEWIDGKVIITAIDNSVEADISIGDEIVSIDGSVINDILEKEGKKISHGNRQGLLATVINPGYFIGAEGSVITFGVIHKGSRKIVEIPRTMYAFMFTGYGGQREADRIFDNNTGYINLAAFMDAGELESTLASMMDTRSLILDLRSSYPVDDYRKFLQMLCPETCTIRQSRVPVISATGGNVWQYENDIISPDSEFSYNKPVIVLIDKTMISRPEDIAIALSSFPNVSFVGEQTQGADGEVAKILLPGGGEVTFTGQDVSFGNGDRFQGIGIIPDVEVKRSVEGVLSQKDEVLEKAFEMLNGN